MCDRLAAGVMSSYYLVYRTFSWVYHLHKRDNAWLLVHIGIWLLILPMVIQIMLAVIHSTPVGIENIAMGIGNIPMGMQIN